MSRTKRLTGGALNLALGSLVVALDQLTKHWAADAFSGDPGSGPRLLGDWLTLTYTTNSGAAFGMLGSRNILFLFVGLVVLGVIAVAWRYLPSGRATLRISLGLQLGGAIGNLLDRVRQGYVTDFIQVKGWPVFNVADSAICCGVALLMWQLLRAPSKAPEGRDTVP